MPRKKKTEQEPSPQATPVETEAVKIEEPKKRTTRAKKAPQAAATEAKPAKRGRTKKAAEEPVAEAVVAPEPEKKTRRPATKKPVEKPEPTKAKRKTEEPAVEPEPKKPATRTRRRAQPRPEPKPEPPKVSRFPVAKVEFVGGAAMLKVGEETLPPFIFFGYYDDSETEERVWKQVGQAVNAGLKVVSFLIPVRSARTGGSDALASIKKATTRLVESHPDAYVIWRLVPTPHAEWQADYPEAVMRLADGTVGPPSVCADRWWEEIERALVEIGEGLEEWEHGDRTLGFHLDRGEWFYSEDGGYDASGAALIRFRQWARKRYGDDVVRLRAAWHDGSVTFNTVGIPPYKSGFQSTEPHLYESRRERRWIDYHMFLSEATATRITALAAVLRKASRNRCAIGASYGYSFEFGHPHSGHLALHVLLNSPDIEIISAPPSYKDRQPTGAAPSPVPVDSVALHGKLFVSEEDFATPFGVRHVDEDFNPPLRTSDAVAACHKRGIGAAVAHGAGVAWMDLWGLGWLNYPEIWERARQLIELWKLRSLAPLTPPDVAIIVDEGSVAHNRVGSNLMRNMLATARESAHRCGASVGFYVMRDLMRDEWPKATLYVFLNAWNVRPDERAAIRQRLQRSGRTLAWIYVGALYENHRLALEAARETTGIALAKQPWASSQGTQILDKRHLLAQYLDGDRIGSVQRFDPSFYALPNGAKVIGEYIDTGNPSMVAKEYKDWKAVFVGERTLSLSLLRGLCAYAGVKTMSATDDVLVARPPFVTIHAAKSGEKRLRFADLQTLYDVEAETMVAIETKEFAFQMAEGETRIFLVGSQEQVESLLHGEPIAYPIKVEAEPDQKREPRPRRDRDRKRPRDRIDSGEAAVVNWRTSPKAEEPKAAAPPANRHKPPRRNRGPERPPKAEPEAEELTIMWRKPGE
ncbi:MAG: hypothetical protein HUU60_05670 [Armatimonadetes bacterium]|nr:hypothetical protein [Armatimonadota bacterium]